jgi:hypothetical protein
MLKYIFNFHGHFEASQNIMLIFIIINIHSFLLEKLVVAHLVKISPTFIKNHSSQEAVTAHESVPNESNTYNYVLLN